MSDREERTISLTVEELRHTEAWLRASGMEMTPELKEAWSRTPVGRVAEKMAVALGSGGLV